MTSNPRPITPNDDPREHPARSPGNTLVARFGGLVDSLRQMYTDFGMRPYRVFSVVYRWTGGDVGLGEMELASEQELLPTPKLTSDTIASSVRREPQSAGYVERGGLKLKEVSPRYTEDDIRVLFHKQPLPKGFQGFIEIFVDERDGKTERRRFVVQDMPVRDAGKFQWSVGLIRQDAQRDRDRRVLPIDRGRGIP